MTKPAKHSAPSDLIDLLIQGNFLFQGMSAAEVSAYLDPSQLIVEKLYSSRPIYTAFRPDHSLEHLYVITAGGPVVIRSTPLDRIISLTYPGGCFGMRNLDFAYGKVCRAFPSLVEAYKTTDVVKIPVQAIKALYENNPLFCDRYNLLFELREKFQYHLLNCSAYPPQAVASLLRALIYQERMLRHLPDDTATFDFDLPIDIIAKACQLNHRTVEQVLKGMVKVGLLKSGKASDGSNDIVHVINPEDLKEAYSATRDKVSWWPLR